MARQRIKLFNKGTAMEMKSNNNRISEKSFWIVRGLPGSGKSTAAKVMIPHLTLSADDFFMVGNRYCFRTELLGVSHQWNQGRAEEACKNNESLIIVDNTNVNWKEVKPYVDIAAKYGYHLHIVEPNTVWKYDVEECFRRNTHRVPKEVIQAMSDRWESTQSIIDKISAGGGRT